VITIIPYSHDRWFTSDVESVFRITTPQTCAKPCTFYKDIRWDGIRFW